MKKKLVIGFSVVGIVIILFGVLYWQWVRMRNTATDPAVQKETARLENQALIILVKRHILLPENEAPTIATIDNAQDLANEQDFFKNAQNGDKLLIYPKAKQAFIYSPSRDVVVVMGPTSFGEAKTDGVVPAQ